MSTPVRILRLLVLSPILWIVLGAVSVSVQEQAAQSSSELGFVFENSRRRHDSFNAGTIQLRSGPGWLRIPKVFSNFQLKLEFRVLDEETDAGLAVRTWTGRGEWPDAGYRIRFSDPRATRAGSLVEGRRRTVKTLTSASPTWQPVGEWQILEVVAEAQQLTVSLNGQPAGVFEIEERAGHVLLDTRKGVVEVRRVTLRTIPRSDECPDTTMTAEALKEEGGTMPRVIAEVRPRYSYEAMSRKLQGQVRLEAVVLPTGSPTCIRVTRPLDADLDEAAMAALERWRFTPAILKGRPVPVNVWIEMTFTLR